jgi:hypothetical protein
MGDEKAVTAETTYVVQRMVKIEESGYWEDVATVAVPSKSKRDTVIRAALTEAKLEPKVGGEPLWLRVLDDGAARVSEVQAKQPPVQIEIG